MKEILRACGNLVSVEMIWLKGILENSGVDNGSYEIVMRATFDNKALACVDPVTRKYGLTVRHEDGLWIFSKENGSKRVSSPPSAL